MFDAVYLINELIPAGPRIFSYLVPLMSKQVVWQKDTGDRPKFSVMRYLDIHQPNAPANSLGSDPFFEVEIVNLVVL